MKKTSFKPCRVVLKMLSPVVISALPPSLDGILFESLRQRSPGKSDEELCEQLKDVLAYHDKIGVFHASSMRFGVTREQGLVASNYRRVDTLHEGKRSSEMFLPNGKNRYVNIVVAGGPTKSRMTVRPAYSAPYVVFDALGDTSAIADLLCNTFVGVGYDALNVGMGGFDTESIEIIVLEEDLSLVENGLAMRPVPTGFARGEAVLSPLVPPYYQNKKHQCSAPERIRLLNVELF